MFLINSRLFEAIIKLIFSYFCQSSGMDDAHPNHAKIENILIVEKIFFKNK